MLAAARAEFFRRQRGRFGGVGKLLEACGIAVFAGIIAGMFADGIAGGMASGARVSLQSGTVGHSANPFVRGILAKEQ